MRLFIYGHMRGFEMIQTDLSLDVDKEKLKNK